MLRSCRRPQRTHRPATKLPHQNRPVRIRRKTVSWQLKPCSGNSRPGRRSERRRHASPCSPFKMPRHSLCNKTIQHRLRRMFEYRIGSCKSADKSDPSTTRGQRYARNTSENRSGERSGHAQNVRPYKRNVRPHKMPEHRTRPCKMPRRCRSCSASATRPGACPAHRRGRRV